MLAFVLCNELRRRELKHDDFVYEGNSPDEITLANFASQFELVFEFKTDKAITVRNKEGREGLLCLISDESTEYKVLEIFPFESARKRMGIILENRATGDIE